MAAVAALIAGGGGVVVAFVVDVWMCGVCLCRIGSVCLMDAVKELEKVWTWIWGPLDRRSGVCSMGRKGDIRQQGGKASSNIGQWDPYHHP